MGKIIHFRMYKAKIDSGISLDETKACMYKRSHTMQNVFSMYMYKSLATPSPKPFSYVLWFEKFNSIKAFTFFLKASEGPMLVCY